jgi:hypothetical protein
VKLNGVKVLYESDASNLSKAAWKPFNINLTDFTGVNLSNVTGLSIGFERIGFSGGSGKVLFDDIRLYPFERQLITPTEPNNAGLVMHLGFDEGFGTVAGDLSGNGNDGTLIGGPQWVAGMIGGALEFDGSDDYVDCGNNAIFDITEQVTLAVWVKTNDAGNGQHNMWLGKGDHTYAIKHASDNSLEFFVYSSGGWHTLSYAIDSSFNGVWHHVAGTFDGNELLVYLDGGLVVTLLYTGSIETRTHIVSMGENSEASGRFYDGLLDDARIYNRALSSAEAAWLSGRIKPFDKPF